MEFTPINTQEEFDARVREVHGDIAGLQGQIKGYETESLKRKIAGEKGIPLEFASRLTGENEADIKADADRMTGLLRAYKGTAPLAEPNQNNEDAGRAHMRSLLRKMKGE